MTMVQTWCRNTPLGFYDKIFDLYKQGEYLEWAAIWPGGSAWTVITKKGRNYNSGLSSDVEAAMTKLKSGDASITRVFFSKGGGWSVHNSVGKYIANEVISQKVKDGMDKLGKVGKIVCLAFHPTSGASIAINENGDRDIVGTFSDNFLADFDSLSKKPNRVVCVAFPRAGDGWTIVSSTGAYLNWNTGGEPHMIMGYFDEVHGPNQFACYDPLGPGWVVAARKLRQETVWDNGKGKGVEILKIYENIQETLQGKCVGYACTIGKDFAGGSFSAGLARTSADGTPQLFLPSTKINLCSGSKVLTTLAAIRLLDEKNISYDDTIGNYLPKDWTDNMSDDAKAISFWMLLSHHSGIKEQGSGETFVALKAFFISLGISATSDQWKPDKKGRYSNWNFAIFRVLLPLIDGFKLGAPDPAPAIAAHYISLVQKYVFDPIGIKNMDTEPPKTGGQSTAYALSYPYPFNGKGIDHKGGTLVAGGGSWWVTIGELREMLNSLAKDDGRILSSAQLTTMTANAKYPITSGFLCPYPPDPDPSDPKLRYGRLGWDNTDNDGTTRWIQKNGGLTANSTSMAIMGADVYGALVINSEVAPPNHQIGWSWCQKCHILHFSDNGTGVCSANFKSAPHDTEGSKRYLAARGVAPADSEAGWKYCQKCDGLFNNNGPKRGPCWGAANGDGTFGDHDPKKSGDYFVVHDLKTWPFGMQDGWGRCNNCQLLASVGGANNCPGFPSNPGFGPHDFHSTPNYGLAYFIGADDVLFDAYKRAMF